MNKRNYGIALAAILTITSLTPIKIFAAEDLDVKKETEEAETVMELSLDQAIEYALENSKDMVIQRLELDKAKVSYDQNIRAVKSAEKAQDIEISVPRTYEVTPDDIVNRALITHGASRKSVELAYQAAKWDLDIKENQIRYNVEKEYYDLLQVGNELKIAEENLQLSKKQYEYGKLRYELGTISNQQLLGVELGLYQTQGAYDAARTYYDLQLMNFQSTLGLPLSQKVVLTDIIEYKEYELIDLEDSINKALENNTSIKLAKENYEISKLTLKAVSGRFPENTYRYKEQEVIVEQAAKNLDTVKVGVEVGVRSSILNLINTEKQIATYEKAIEQAKKALAIAEKSFELGRSTFTEVTQANINLMNAKKNLSQQIHAFNLALLDYEYSIGIGKGFQ